MTILQAKIVNFYKSKRPLGFYHLIKGHSGVDLNYVNEKLPSPITGKVVAVLNQKEMGRCIYIKDYVDNIHVFSHMLANSVHVGDEVKRNDILGVTGNSGKKTKGAHLHYEIICKYPINSEDKIMTRKLYAYTGYNTEPIKYIRRLYAQFNVGDDGVSLIK